VLAALLLLLSGCATLREHGLEVRLLCYRTDNSVLHCTNKARIIYHFH
jgi:hypothetical protein